MNKDLFKKASVVALVALLLVGIGYFIWFSPLLMLIGVILFVINIVILICYLTRKSTDESTDGCGCALFAFLTIILVFSQRGDYKIFTFGGYRHLYTDCPKRESESYEELGSVSARIWGCTKDCPECEIRKQQESEHYRIERREQKKNFALRFIDIQINRLEELRKEIINDDDIDIDDIDIYDYEFKIDVEQDIRDEAIEDYRDENTFFRP